MWLFKQKEQKPKPIKLYIPKEKRLKFYSLCDNYFSLKNNENKLARYNLWRFIEDIFPEVSKGKWVFNHEKTLNPYIVQILED